MANTAGGAAKASLFGIAAQRWMFLVGAGRKDEALTVLNGVLGPDEVPEDRIAEIERAIAESEAHTERTTLRGPRLGLLRIVWVDSLLSVFQQFVEITAIFYCSTTLWKAVGFEESQSLTVSVLTAVTNVAVTFIAIAFIDKLGRRPLLLTGSAGMTVSLGVMSLAFTHTHGTGEAVRLAAPFSVVALVATNAFVIFFGTTWGPAAWVLFGEMLPHQIRATALDLAASAQWIANFAITIGFPPLLGAFGATVPCAMYAAFAALSFVCVLARATETKSVEHEDVKG